MGQTNHPLILQKCLAAGRALIVLTVSLSLFAAKALAVPPQSDQDQLFTQGVADYNQNRFTDARAKFEKVQGAHSQEAKKYVDKIAGYTDAMSAAKSIMDRTPDELDSGSVAYAIQEYEEAIKIKPDGPWHPADQLEKAKGLKSQVDQKHAATNKTAETQFCQKALGAAQEHRYKEAARYSCPLANDNPAYSCGGDEAVHMCEQYTALAKIDDAGSRPVEPVGQADPLARAKAAYERNDFDRARTLFGKMSGESKPVADEYLGKISEFHDAMAQAEQLAKASKYEEAHQAFASAASIKPDGPGNPQVGALRMELAEGIDQFYSGEYVAAIQHLENYAQSSAGKASLAHFYLGASKLARFFISGSEDQSLREAALRDLKIAKQTGYKAEAQDVSPRILQAYRDLAF